MILTPVKGIVIIKNFLSKGLAKDLLSKIHEEAVWNKAEIGKYDKDKLVHSEVDLNIRDIEVSIIDNESQNLIENELPRLKLILQKQFGISKFEFGEFMTSRYEVGSHIKPHSDTGVYSTNRLITCILYLNQEFKGGELYFPDFNFSFKPSTGDLIAFWSEYSHGVSELLSGERACCVFFARSLVRTTLFK